MARIELHNIIKRYGAVEVVHGVDLAIDDGEFVVFVGPSGCGKSTILRMIAGLEEISGGELRIDGERMNDVAPSQRGIAMVFQSYALYPHMTVRKNLSFGLETARVPRDEIDRKVNQAAQVLQIDALLDRKPKQLSGGQRQRVAIGRAIVREPRLFLFDEPLSNLDAELRVQMRAELAALHDKLAATMIYVTHDQTEAMTLADKIVVLERGRLHQVGSPLELYNHPKNKFVAGFIGSPKMNFLEAKVREVDGTHLTAQVSDGPLVTADVKALGAKAGDAVTIGIRPHHLKRAEPPNAAFTGRVELVELLGNESVVRMALANGSIMTVCLDGSVHAARGDSLAVGFAPENLHVFDAAGNAL